MDFDNKISYDELNYYIRAAHSDPKGKMTMIHKFFDEIKDKENKVEIDKF